MRRAFSQMFWGMIVVAVDIKVDECDLLLPDLLGYALIVSGLRHLSAAGRDFLRAQPYAIIAAFVSIPATLGFDPGNLLTLSTVVLDAITVWYVCAGIIELAAERGNRVLLTSAESCRKLYCVAALASLTVATLRIVSTELAVVLVIPAVVLAFTSAILVMLLLRRASADIV